MPLELGSDCWIGIVSIKLERNIGVGKANYHYTDTKHVLHSYNTSISTSLMYTDCKTMVYVWVDEKREVGKFEAGKS